jgi:hypothetical protein
MRKYQEISKLNRKKLKREREIKTLKRNTKRERKEIKVKEIENDILREWEREKGEMWGEREEEIGGIEKNIKSRNDKRKKTREREQKS